MAAETNDDTPLTKLVETGYVHNAHAAAAYTKWLKAEIQEALDDPSASVSHEEAMRQIRAALKLR